MSGQVVKEPKAHLGNPNWRKGVSGNPKGAPPGKRISALNPEWVGTLPKHREASEMIAAARAASHDMLAGLIHLAKHAKGESVRAICLQAVLNRAWGMPTQPVAAAITDMAKMSLEDQQSLAAAILTLQQGQVASPLTIEGTTNQPDDGPPIWKPPE